MAYRQILKGAILKIELLEHDNIHTVQLFPGKGGFQADLDGEKILVRAQMISANCLTLCIGNCIYCVCHAESGGKQYLTIQGESYCFELNDTNDNVRRKQSTGCRDEQSRLSLTAPMPGNVLKINVQEGDLVEEGQCLAVIEAMKMETGIHSALTARVKKIFTILGNQVDAGERLIELERIDGSGEEGEEKVC
jgi:biotin carboxyl carrier protein